MPIKWKAWKKSKTEGFYRRIGRNEKGKVYLEFKRGSRGKVRRV